MEDIEKKEIEHEKNEYKDFFLYFIGTNLVNSLGKIELIKNKYCENFGTIKDSYIYLKNNNKAFYTINKIKIKPKGRMNTLIIKFNIMDSKEKNFISEIELKDFSHDFFIMILIIIQKKIQKKIKKVLIRLDQFYHI